MSEFFLDACTELVEKREALQQHIQQRILKIRRRLRSKYGRSIEHGAYDIDDILSSMRRRVDAAMSEGKIRAHTIDELDAYIHRIVDHLVVDAIRRSTLSFRQLDALRMRLPTIADRPDLNLLESANRVLSILTDDERAAVGLRLDGCSMAEIAQVFEISVEAQRGRWKRLCRRLRSLLVQ